MKRSTGAVTSMRATYERVSPPLDAGLGLFKNDDRSIFDKLFLVLVSLRLCGESANAASEDALDVKGSVSYGRKEEGQNSRTSIRMRASPMVAT